ncbi:TIGR03790 family protein [Zavarzinella formosa]|uniref:TIGR03790 family protein n=1 Tax=Zavarzinella formosa TaxID=360055 RepID=UPI0002D7CA78|nr:TIGR03790 family protein [Zavarzinella formosa]
MPIRANLLLLLVTSPVFALDPGELILIVNKNEPASAELAEYYAKVRNVPAGNIVTLDLPKGESISRSDYDKKLLIPLRMELKDRKEKVRCLVCMYGTPLRVGNEDPSPGEKEELAKLAPQIKEVEEAIKKCREEIAALEKTAKDDTTGKDALLKKEREQELNTLNGKQNRLNRQRSNLSHAESTAAVDSELMMLWFEKYELRRWQLNLNHWQVPAKEREGKPPVLLACRLDGPDPKIVRRMIDDAIETEKAGLKGKVYVDARGIALDLKGDPRGTGYGGYDQSMRDMAALLKDAGKMDVILDDKDPVFQPNTCPDTALYCGWYSHAKFVDSATFAKGAVAWHLASSEAVSLRSGTTFWCPNLLAKGVCATLGPVSEPYTIGFPKPAEFFGFLATGQFTLAESYGKTVYFTSWMGTLIGDPLYNPFKATPRLKESDVFVSPKGVPSPFGKP